MKRKKSQVLCCSVLSVLLTVLQLFSTATDPVPPGYDNMGVILYEVMDESGNVITDPSHEGLTEVVDILYVRLSNLGYVEASVKVQDNGQLKVNVPDVDDIVNLSQTLEKTGLLTFEDYDGNILLDGTMIKDANYRFGPVDETGVNASHIELAFTEEGQKAFTEATEQISARTGDGTNVICICLDGQLYSAPTVMDKIDAPSCIITGDFNEESAKELASILSSGALPYKIVGIQTEIIVEE